MDASAFRSVRFARATVKLYFDGSSIFVIYIVCLHLIFLFLEGVSLSDYNLPDILLLFNFSFNLISILKRHKRSLSAVNDALGMLGAGRALKRQIRRF